jgi:hypothetical protein
MKLRGEARSTNSVDLGIDAFKESALSKPSHSPIACFLKMRSRALLYCFVSLSLFAFTMLASAQEKSAATEPPAIIRITPSSAAPQTRIKLEGYRLGANLDQGVRVLFIRGETEYDVAPNGGGYETANLKQGIQDISTQVPEELQPGPCQVIVEVEGQRSTTFTVQINIPATPPTLTDFRPHSPRPGELIWIEGTGFSDSDEFELTDALGKPHLIVGGGTSDADTSAFTLPKDLPPGETRLRVIEHRSGTNQSSNVVSLTIVNGPTPLEIESDWLMPVAAAQWLDLVVGSTDPLKSAERVEVLFQQQQQVVIVATKSPNENGLRVRVPESLAAGNVTLQTRTVVSGEASAWSEPVNFSLLDKPAAAKIYSLEIRPVRAEAGFRQDGRLVAIVPVDESDYPRVRVPTDNLSNGMVEVLTRVWRGGEPSAWLFKHIGFYWPGKFLPDGTMGELPFMDRIYLGPDTPRALTVYPGEKLILLGTFPVEAVADVEITLKCDGRAPVTLHPIEVTSPRGAKVTLPDDLEDGDWEVSVRNIGDGESVKLPINLGISKTSQARKLE